MDPTLWYVVIAIVATMFVANSAARGEVIFLDLAVVGAITLLCLAQVGVV